MKIYNTLSQKKELLQPIDAKKVGIYVCGLTVYDYCHIGNARSAFVTFDVVVRYLRARGFDVKYVRNITDIDDKIIKRAKENEEDYRKLTKRFINYMHEDERALGSLPPDIEPLATENMPQIIDMIKTLIEKDYAYIADNGDVYYDVGKFENYGRLAHQDIEKLQIGVRIEISKAKHSPLDFVLWKRSKLDEPAWNSPWGKGRPGWHIECSAMSKHYLGEHFDIHGGGTDLQFPHHQNEIAQSEAACNCKSVNIWMHVGYVQVDRQKMSKSLGNFFTLRDVLKHYNPEVIRYFMIASHYRSPLNYSHENLDNAKAALDRLYIALRDLPVYSDSKYVDKNLFIQKFYEMMDDDFNTPQALSVLFDIVKEINRLRSNKKNEKLKETVQLGMILKKLGGILGILQQNPEIFLHANINQGQAKEIESLIKERNLARQDKKWKEADQIRDQLKSINVELEDTDLGTIWHYKIVK